MSIEKIRIAYVVVVTVVADTVNKVKDLIETEMECDNTQTVKYRVGGVMVDTGKLDTRKVFQRGNLLAFAYTHRQTETETRKELKDWTGRFFKTVLKGMIESGSVILWNLETDSLLAIEGNAETAIIDAETKTLMSVDWLKNKGYKTLTDEVKKEQRETEKAEKAKEKETANATETPKPKRQPRKVKENATETDKT